VSSLFFASTAEPSMDCPARSLRTQASDSVSELETLRVGTVPRHTLTDAEREAAIKRAGDLIVHYMNLWEKTSDFQYRGDADRAKRLMYLLIEGRSQAQKDAMERARGLA
jgi:hypothetical protein